MKALVVLLMLILIDHEHVWAQVPYYQGKTVNFIVGSGTGTAYDMYARLLGAQIGKYLAGIPAVIMQNISAAGGADSAGVK